MLGSDPLATAPVWRVGAALPDWLSLAVDSATMRATALDLGTSRLEGGSSTSPSRRRRRRRDGRRRTRHARHRRRRAGEPHRLGLRRGLRRRRARRSPVGVGRAGDGRRRAVRRAGGGRRVRRRRGPRGAAIQIVVGAERFINFQSCDVDALPVQHSLPSQTDTRRFVARLIDAAATTEPRPPRRRAASTRRTRELGVRPGRGRIRTCGSDGSFPSAASGCARARRRGGERGARGARRLRLRAVEGATASCMTAPPTLTTRRSARATA